VHRSTKHSLFSLICPNPWIPMMSSCLLLSWRWSQIGNILGSSLVYYWLKLLVEVIQTAINLLGTWIAMTTE
jgi:hypothetical protein